MPRSWNWLITPAKAPDWFRQFVADLNRTHVSIAQELAKVQGLDGQTPELHNSPDLQGNQLRNVGPATHDSHVVTVADAVKNSLYKRTTDTSHVASFPIDATAGVRVPHTVEPTHAPPLSQVQGSIGDAITTKLPPQPIDAVTNNVTSGGVSGTIANYTDLVTYSNDAASIRNDLYQLARSVKQLTDALRTWGIGV